MNARLTKPIEPKKYLIFKIVYLGVGKVNIIKRITAVLLSVSIIITICLPVFAENKSSKIVRVGCVDTENFFKQDSIGKYSGYAIEYLEEISQYTDWEYEYVDGTWAECMQWLSEGKIDLLLPAEYSDDRAEDYLYSKYECCIDYVALYAQLDDNTHFYEDYKSFDNMKIGMITGNYLNVLFEENAKKLGFSFIPLYYDNMTSLHSALTNGEVEGIVSGNMNNCAERKLLAKFDTMPAYFISNKNNTDLMTQLDDAMFKINLDNPYFVAKLHEKYYGEIEREAVGFTKEEAEYIKTCDKLTIGCDQNNYPLEWYDAVSGTYKGVYVDFLKLISERSGLEFEIVKTDSLSESWEKVKNGEIDLVSGVYGNKELENAYNVSFSDSYYTENNIVIGKQGTTYSEKDNITVAVLDSFIGTQYFIKEKYPHWNIITGGNINECLSLVHKGMANVAFVNANALQIKPYMTSYSSLVIVSTITGNVPMGIGISNKNSPLLKSVLNKTLMKISQDELDTIVINDTVSVPYQITFTSLIVNYPVQSFIVLGVFLSLVFIGCFMLYKNRANARRNAVLQQKNSQLQEAIIIAGEANRAKTSFLSNMSHDIRTPMNAIVGMTEIAKENQQNSEKVSDCLNKISNSTNYLLSLINNILDVSKIESGKMVISKAPFSLNELLKEIDLFCNSYLKSRRIRFSMSYDKQIKDTLVGDKLHLNQVLVNLLSNAFKFTAIDGSVVFTVKQITNSENGCVLRFSVTNSGCGIEKELLEKIFVPFEQGKNTKINEIKGSGLGLAIVQSFVEMMNGVVKVESEVGKGSTFMVEIPFSYCDADEESFVEQFAEINIFSGENILIAEDNELNLEIMKEFVKRLNITPVCANDGSQAVDIFKNSPTGYFSAILMDIRMPVMDGREATKVIRNLNREDSEIIPVIAVSADAFSDDVKFSQSAGMNDYITKPVSINELSAVLSKYMGKTNSSI